MPVQQATHASPSGNLWNAIAFWNNFFGPAAQERKAEEQRAAERHKWASAEAERAATREPFAIKSAQQAQESGALALTEAQRREAQGEAERSGLSALTALVLPGTLERPFTPANLPAYHDLGEDRGMVDEWLKVNQVEPGQRPDVYRKFFMSQTGRPYPVPGMNVAGVQQNEKGENTAKLAPPVGPPQLVSLPGYGDVGFNLGPDFHKLESPTQKPTAEQSKASMFLENMRQSSMRLNKLEGSGPFEGQRGKFYDPSAAVPTLNLLKSKDRQQYEADAANWSMSLLRMESGGAITPAEIKTYREIYFPSLSDGPEMVKYKAGLRAQKEASIEAGFGNQPAAANGKRTAPTVPPTSAGATADNPVIPRNDAEALAAWEQGLWVSNGAGRVARKPGAPAQAAKPTAPDAALEEARRFVERTLAPRTPEQEARELEARMKALGLPQAPLVDKLKLMLHEVNSPAGR